MTTHLNLQSLSSWVKVENPEKPELNAGGLGAARAPGGSRATPWPGVQGAGGPRKLLSFVFFMGN